MKELAKRQVTSKKNIKIKKTDVKMVINKKYLKQR